jgi:hypothetical protein
VVQTSGGTDAPGIIGLIFGILALVALVLGCIFFPLVLIALPLAFIGGLISFFARGNLKVAGLVLNGLITVPVIACNVMALFGIAGLAGLGALGKSVPAASSPPRPLPTMKLASEVRDNGGFFSANAISKANDIIKDIHRDFKKDLLIETFKTVPEGKVEEVKKMDKADRNKFFANWARDQAKTAEVNGVYIQICKDPGHLDVEVGNVTSQKVFTIANRDELADRMLARLQEGKNVKNEADKKNLHDEVLLDAVRYVRRKMNENQ